MDQNEKNEKFVELYSFEQMKYSEIEQEMEIGREEVQKLYKVNREDIAEIQAIRNKFTGKRRKDFGSFKEFYNWYVGSKKQCGYCGITQDELTFLFQEERILPLNDAAKRSSGTLEIERRDSSSNSYSRDNIILACPLCNNAKSNLIDEKNWRELFVEPMRKYYKILLGKDLKEPIPP